MSRTKKNSFNNVNSFPIYVINLEDRVDRFQESSLEARRCGIEVKFISAIDSHSLSVQKETFLTPQATACWLSHLKAMQELTDSGHDFGLILEDDFTVKRISKFKSTIENTNMNQWDLIQIGFLNIGIRSRIDTLFANLENLLFYILAKLVKKFSWVSDSIGDRLRVKRAEDVPWGYVPDDLRAGAHAYLITSKMAETLLKDYRNQNVLTADGFLIATNWTRPFRTLRLKKSLVGQTNSISSIKV